MSFGEAWVTLHIKGDQVEGEIEKAVNDAASKSDTSKGGDQLGKSLGKDTKKAFVGELDDLGKQAVARLQKEKMGQGIGQNITVGMGQELDRFWGDDFLKGANFRLRDVGKEMGRIMVAPIVQQFDLLKQTKAFKALEAGKRVGTDLATGLKNITAPAFKDIKDDFDKSFKDAGGAIGMVGGALQFIFSRFTSLGANFAGIGKGLAGLAGIGGGGIGDIGKGLAGIAMNGPLAVVALGAIGVAMSGVAVLASALLGLIVALSSSLSFGLVGAAVVAGGALVPLAALAAGVVVAFKNMSNELTPVMTQIGNEVSQIFRKGIDVRPFATALKSLTPLLEEWAQASVTVVNWWGKALNGPEIRGFIQALQQQLPGMMLDLGSASMHLSEAFANIFRIALPYVKDFTQWLSIIAQHFVFWTDSASGQNAIKKFFDEAVESAKGLGRLLGQLGGLLGDLLFDNTARKAGDDLFAGITRSIHDLRDFIKKAKEDGSWDQWMKEAKDFGEGVGKVIKDIIDFFAKMNTPENKKLWAQIGRDLLFVLGLFPKVAGAIDSLTLPFRLFFDVIKLGFHNLVQTVLWFVGQVIDGAAKAFGWIPGIGDKLKNAAAEFHQFASNVTDAINGVPQMKDISATARAGIIDLTARLQSLPGLEGRIFGGGAFSNLPGGLNVSGAWTGGIRSGLTLVGERGPELLSVPPNTKVYNNTETRQIVASAAQASGDVTINQNFYGPQSGSDRLRELDWTIRYATSSGTGVNAGVPA